MRNSFDKPFGEGQARELELFMELLTSEESRAQRHIFFAEREAQKVPDMPAGVKPREVRKGGVIGAGTMGGGIAMNFANAGIPVTIVETAQDALDRGPGDDPEELRQHRLARRADPGGGRPPRRPHHRLDRLRRRLRDADFIIEAVFEEMDLKKRIFADLDRIAKPGAILATNTSTLDVNEIAAVDEAPAGRARHAFLQPGERHEAARDRARREDRLRRARDRDRGRAQDGQGAGRRRGLLRLRRQPHAAPAHARRPSG